MTEDLSQQRPAEQPATMVAPSMDTAQPTTEKRPGSTTQHFSYYIDAQTNTITQITRKPTDNLVYEDHSFDKHNAHARVERLDVDVVSSEGKGMKDNKVTIFSEIHADEGESATLLYQLLKDKKFDRTQALNVNIAAALIGLRGQFVELFPGKKWGEVTEKMWGDVNRSDRIAMLNGREVDVNTPGALIGKIVDLNRQYDSKKLDELISSRNGQPLTYEDLYKLYDYPEAQLQLKMMEDSPNAEILFSIHEDRDRGKLDSDGTKRGEVTEADGFYMYIINQGSGQLDPEVTKHYNNLIQSLVEKGFDIYDGIDDPEDPDLGLKANRGLITQSTTSEDGTTPQDKSFEGMMVRLGKEGLNKIKQAVLMEIPMHLSFERKQEMLKIILEKFIEPLSAQHNAAHTQPQ